MGLFVYTQKGSIISMVDLPTTEIIEPQYLPHLLKKKVAVSRITSNGLFRNDLRKAGLTGGLISMVIAGKVKT